MFEYNFFYRKHGVRQVTQLVSPPLSRLDTLDLPKRSIYHYLGNDPNEVGPGANHFLFRNVSKVIMIDTLEKLGDNLGSPRRLPIPVEPLLRKYFIKNRRFRPLRDLEASSRDNLTLVVYNYALLGRLYRYTRSLYTDYYRWWNIQSKVWDTISKTANVSDRHQFIELALPKVLPSIPDLRIGSEELNQRTVRLFTEPESRMILEIWKWLGEERERSLLKGITRHNAERVNLIFQDAGKWCVVNLGLLNQWRAAPKTELAKDPDAPKKGYTIDQIQKRFLRDRKSVV